MKCDENVKKKKQDFNVIGVDYFRKGKGSKSSEHTSLYIEKLYIKYNNIYINIFKKKHYREGKKYERQN